MEADIDDVVAAQYADGRRAPDGVEQVVQPSAAPRNGHRRRNLALVGVAALILIGAGFSLTHLRQHAAPENPALANIQAIASSVPAAAVKPATKAAAAPETLPRQTVVYQPSVQSPAPAATVAASMTPTSVPAASTPPAPAAPTTPVAAVPSPLPSPAMAAGPVAGSPGAVPRNAAQPAAATPDQRAQIEALTEALAKATAEAAAAQAALADAKAAKPKVRYVAKRAPSAHLVAILKDGAVLKTDDGKTVVLSVGAKVP